MPLFLKYRPRDFDSLSAQNFIKETLKKSVQDDKLVWAYLFCWPRGTWKTSSARIFAKAINCQNPKSWNPCQDCDICNSFDNGSLVDIIEIDAASNTWVDNIRSIIERAQFSPNKTKYKIYIIDEVHMLSKWAFNALLKILEEPPEHVKFILATTEVHKIPETILSRCQRYDFENIPNEDIKSRLEFIAKAESVEIDDKSMEFIVKNSMGWLRNAISLFEQFIVNSSISYENIEKNLWLSNSDEMDNFYKMLLEKDIKALEFVESFRTWSKNIKVFFRDFIYFLKEKLILDLDKNYTENIYFIDTFLDSYSKSKTSFDESLVFLVWVAKIIWWYSENTKIVERPEKIVEKKNDIKKEEKTNNKQKNNLVHDDLMDVFWSSSEEDPFASLESSPKLKEDTISSLDNKWFSIDSLISEIKKEKGKSFLSLWIKSSKCDFSDNTLKIKSKTKFNFDKMNTSDNISLIKQKLDYLWYKDAWVEIIF